jgi:hypothetical protein
MFKKIAALLLRVAIYLFFIWLSFFFLMPKITPELLAMILLMPLASVAILLDLFLTAKIESRGVEEVIAKRIILLDNVLAREEDRLSQRRSLETRDVEALPEPNQDRHEQ